HAELPVESEVDARGHAVRDLPALLRAGVGHAVPFSRISRSFLQNLETGATARREYTPAAHGSSGIAKRGSEPSSRPKYARLVGVSALMNQMVCFARGLAEVSSRSL